MPEIRQLSVSVINKIAAGEVIERPASVVKELLENSVDSGARRIEVALGQGGSEYIRVSDDGCGIDPDQLTLAVASHATSKIRDADDLFQVLTLGFRGEALASISEVSRFLIRSRLPDAPAGAQLEVIGGERSPVAPCGCGPGTTIEVRDLFFNTPVRRKFLRASNTELGHATEAFTRVALAAANVHFVFKHNDRVIYDLPPAQSWRERIAAFFGREIGQGLIAVEGSEASAEEIRLSGYVGDPQLSRPNNRLQYLFLNGRFIRDRSLQHALGEAYRGLLLTGRFPIAFLRLEMPAELVDVNVHPTKLEVRFQDSSRIYGQLLGTIRRRFLTTDLTARVAPLADEGTTGATASGAEAGRSFGGAPSSVLPVSGAVDDGGDSSRPAATGGTVVRTGEVAPAWTPGLDWPRPEGRGSEAYDAQHAARQRAELVAWAQGRLPLTTPPAQRGLDGSGRVGSLVGEPPRGRDETPWGSDSRCDADNSPSMPTEGLHREALGGLGEGDASGLRGTSSATPSNSDNTRVGGAVAGEMSSSAGRGHAARVVGVQLQNRYLITENEEGIVIIDQHALHERVLYEQLREKVLGGRFETQRLLVPEPVALTPAEAGILLEARETLACLGIGIEPFGGGTVLVTSYPAMLVNLGPAEVVRQVLERLMAGGKSIDRRDLVDELLHMISCKAAVKAGDRLTPGEVESLLEQRHLFQDTHHCPHGRPTALVFTREELDKRFRRI